MTERQAFRIAVTMLLIALAMIIAAPFVHADSGTPSTFWRASDGWQREHVRRVERRPARQHRHTHKPRVKAWHKAEPAIPRGCFGPVEAFGDQRLGEKGAKLDAEHAWRGAVRARYGEMYQDTSNARAIVYQCFTASIPNAATRALDAVKQAVTGEDAGLLKRCRMAAIACIAPTEGSK